VVCDARLARPRPTARGAIGLAGVRDQGNFLEENDGGFQEQSSLAKDGAEERTSVGRLARGARGDGADLLGPEALSELAVAPNGVDTRLDRAAVIRRA
jgi:hypothetical protein